MTKYLCTWLRVSLLFWYAGFVVLSRRAEEDIAPFTLLHVFDPCGPGLYWCVTA